jgi:hypothetical protein
VNITLSLPLCRSAALPLCRSAALPLCRSAALPLIFRLLGFFRVAILLHLLMARTSCLAPTLLHRALGLLDGSHFGLLSSNNNHPFFSFA